ncbi:hypothetical protein L1887_13072 [Cichorium endivia]|nr:hypothetical protein L1887_13072 [Cichorium endivia]
MNHHKEQPAATIDLSALIAQIMSSESSQRDRGGATYRPPYLRNPNLEGTNIGASMIIHRGGSGLSSGEVNDSCGVNIYVNNNIQGLNNSIMIGSRLYMGDPGVWLTLKDSKLERWFSKKTDTSFLSIGFNVLLILVIVLAFIVMFVM